MIMIKENDGPLVNGYTDKDATTFLFPVERVIRMKVYRHNGKHYVRTRDVADLLGMKQPFQFVANCREILGEGSILNAEDTESFRGAENSGRVTFIEANDLLDYLLGDGTNYLQTYEKGMYTQVVEALRSIVTK